MKEKEITQENSSSGEVNLEEMTLEETFALLEETVSRLEDEGSSLEESFANYSRGMELVKLCYDKIDTVEKKVLQINEAGVLDEF